ESNGPYGSIFDFSARLAGNSLINRRLVESLIQSGAFDSVHPNRRRVFDSLESGLTYASRAAVGRASGMESLFAADDGNANGLPPEPALQEIDEWAPLDKLSREKEMLNFYVSGHPLEEFAADVEAFAQIRLGEIAEDAKFTAPVRACGIITAIRTKLD